MSFSILKSSHHKLRIVDGLTLVTLSLRGWEAFPIPESLSPTASQVSGSPLCLWCFGHPLWRGSRNKEKGCYFLYWQSLPIFVIRKRKLDGPLVIDIFMLNIYNHNFIFAYLKIKNAHWFEYQIKKVSELKSEHSNSLNVCYWIHYLFIVSVSMFGFIHFIIFRLYFPQYA